MRVTEDVEPVGSGTTIRTTTPRKSIADRPTWPYPDLVRLTAHPRGQWCRHYRVDGRSRLAYFGPWSDPDGALARWRARDRAIREGRDTGAAIGGLPPRCTVAQLADAYLAHKRARVSPTGISASSFRSARHAMDVLQAVVDPSRPAAQLGPGDFAMVLEHVGAKAPATIGHVVGGIRRAFTWAKKDHGFPEPVFGSAFTSPRRLVFRRHRRKRALGTYTAAEIRVLLACATPTLRACILLGINGGYGGRDLAEVPASALQRRLGDDAADGERARIVYPRAKTEAVRALSVWPEAVRAIVDAGMGQGSGAMLTSASGGPLTHTPLDSVCSVDNLGRQFRRLLRRTGLGGSFYRLRHTFATIADVLGDRETRRLIMGHAGHVLDESYVHAHGWHRIDATCEAVRRWVFAVDAADGWSGGAWSGVLPRVPEQWKLRPGRPMKALHHRTERNRRAELGLGQRISEGSRLRRG